MRKVFIIHGLDGAPNGGWRPWLMGELQKLGVYACALSMPNPHEPVCDEWVAEIARHIGQHTGDEYHLVGHSLGVAAVLRYLEAAPETVTITSAVLVSGRNGASDRKDLAPFFEPPFNFERIRSRVPAFVVIHGDNDQVVPVENATSLSQALGATLTIVPNGGHLNGSAGWLTLPECLEALKKMMGV